jgi:hypothetical protein
MVLTDEGEKWIDLYADIERDFCCQEHTVYADGEHLPYGYVIWVEREYMMKPVYVDDRRVVIALPRNSLLQVDTESGEAAIVADLNTTINSLIFCAEQRLLLAGGENGVLTTLSTGD